MPNFDPYTFFPKILVDTVTNESAEGTCTDAYRRICDMKIIDLIRPIPLQNFDKTASTIKFHFQDH